MARIALVTCSELADLDKDDRLLLEPLKARGIEAVPVVWDDPHVDWSEFRVSVLRSTWDYPARRDEFLAWVGAVPNVLNPPDVVRWNTDKSYLSDLASAGAPVIPTRWICPGEPAVLPDDAAFDDERDDGEWAAEEYVIKPSIGAGSLDTGRYRRSHPDDSELARDHVTRLLNRGATVMIQPYKSAVDAFGETAMLFLGGEFSHAIRKGPMLDGPDRRSEGLYRRESISARIPSHGEREAAAEVLSAAPGIADLLYARVDLIPGDDGTPILLELELTEPSLFLTYDDAAAERLAAAIAARL